MATGADDSGDEDDDDDDNDGGGGWTRTGETPYRSTQATITNESNPNGEINETKHRSKQPQAAPDKGSKRIPCTLHQVGRCY